MKANDDTNAITSMPPNTIGGYFVADSTNPKGSESNGFPGTVTKGKRTFILNTVQDIETHERNIDKPRYVLQEVNRIGEKHTETPTKDFLEAIDAAKKQAILTYSKEWDKSNLYTANDSDSPAPIIQTHDIHVIFGKINKPKLLKVQRLNTLTDEILTNIINTPLYNYLELFCGNPSRDDFDLDFLPTESAVETASNYSLSELICRHANLSNEANLFKRQLATVKKTTPPPSWKNSLSNIQLIYWHSYAKKLITLNKKDECSNILKNISKGKVRPVWIGDPKNSKTLSVKRAYFDLINGIEYLIELCIEFNILFLDKKAYKGVYTATQLLEKISQLKNSVRNALAVNMIASDFNKAMKNGISVYIELLPGIQTGSVNNVMQYLNEILVHIAHAVAHHSQIPAHLDHLLNFLKNFLHTNLNPDPSIDKLPTLLLDIQQFLTQPRVIRAGEVAFDAPPLTVNIAFYFDKHHTTRSLEQDNCVGCYLFDFDEFKNDETPTAELNPNADSLPALKNAVNTTLNEWQTKSNGNVNLFFHEVEALKANTVDKLEAMIEAHFKRVLEPINTYCEGVVAKEIGDLNTISTSSGYEAYDKFNDSQKKLLIYWRTHKHMKKSTFDFLYQLLNDEIALRAIKVTPKDSALESTENNLSVPVINTAFNVFVKEPHQFFANQGELLIDLGFDTENVHYGIYLGSDKIVELPTSFNGDIWDYQPTLLPSTHYIEPMAVILNSENWKLGDYSRFDINRWYSHVPTDDQLLVDAVNFDGEPNGPFVRSVLVEHIEGNEKVGKFT